MLMTIFHGVTKHRALIYAITRRNILIRFRGSFLGLLWSLVTPLLRLGIYTFVFGTILSVRWPNQQGDTLDFSAMLFAGLICHAFAAEVLVQSTSLIIGNRQYVKKVIFPLESLPWVVVLAALFQLIVSSVVLIIYVVILKSELSWTVVFLPLPFVALAFMMLAIGWLVSATAVFLRDVDQVVDLATIGLLFLSPIFFPVSALPEILQPFIYLNPISFIVEQVRAILLHGEVPDFVGLLQYGVISLIACRLSLAWFQRLRPGFADVI
tara:strand:- start:233 stop:1033 length:801 start_codon:yes stop_codon:yes gene_type:complete